MPDPSASETTPPTTPPSSGKRRWLVVAAVAVAIFIVWTTWGRGGGAGRGGTIQADITLVTSDRDDLACASEKAVGSYRCEFRAPGTPWPDAFAPVDRLAPYYTVDQKLYVIPGLFEQPALAKRYAEEEQRHLAREQRPRFVASCQLKLVDHLKDFQTRWVKTGEWGHQDEAWVAVPSDCRIR
ncbi:MAG TPA: hypothetical protein VLT58_15040 [Polyangia bacterium]|nr:hypothetical protein [Polyangia bacterium]